MTATEILAGGRRETPTPPASIAAPGQGTTGERVLVITRRGSRALASCVLVGPAERDWRQVADLAALLNHPDATWEVQVDTTPRAAADAAATPRPCCGVTPDLSHDADCRCGVTPDLSHDADCPLCPRCREPIRYERAAHAGGGDSTWVHRTTGAPTCADGQGRCERPKNWKPDTARRTS